MKAARVTVPKKIAEGVLREYNHHCAMCGRDRPHLHHIDEDPSNNDSSNLLPLCPNCHLRDQHNPTHNMETGKLQLFRIFKAPGILRPQFHPVFKRQEFLGSVQQGDTSVAELERQANELIELAHALEMGNFYAKRLEELIGPLPYPPDFSFSSDGQPSPESQHQLRERNVEYRAKLTANQSAVQFLLVEQLRYQRWANEAS